MNPEERIVKRWTDTFFARYPIKPINEIVEYVREATTKIFNEVIKGYYGKKSNLEVDDALDDLMRFLASDVNLSPADSIRLIGNLKYIIADEMKLNSDERLKLFEVIDEVIYKAFDYYMKCREKIFELRLKEKDREVEIMRKILECASRAMRNSKP